jgi:chitin synthase
MKKKYGSEQSLEFMVSHFYQKIIIFCIWFAINTTFIVTSIVYMNYWYIFIVPLSLSTSFNCMSVILIVLYSIKNCIFKKSNDVPNLSTKSIAYLIPCYNENEQELKNTICSLKTQQKLENNKKVMFIVCDGRVKGPDSEVTTDQVLKHILKDDTVSTRFFPNAYKTWTSEYNNVEVLYGITDNIPFVCMIKDNNVGKRDGLVLIRSLLYNFNNNIINPDLSDDFENFVKTFMESHVTKVDYIVGTDADTVFDPLCTFNLLQTIEQDDNTHGVVGFVHVSPDVPKWSIWCIYQFTEYIIAQCLRRVQQSIVTNKVSCLSGCVQILRVSEETCGDRILKAFNALPNEDDNVWRHILSFASEDRNHVCLMLHMYPHVKTRQCLTATAYTIVPTSLAVFRSQRRRWSLGATGNDVLLSYKSGINLYERIGAIFNVLTYSLSLFIFVATIMFYYSIFAHPNIIMLYLSTIIFVPILYEICIIFWFPFPNKIDIFRFFVGLIFYLLFGSIVNITICVYSLLNVDCFKWGKTRMLNNESQEQINN